jgi:hypothetical protein
MQPWKGLWLVAVSVIHTVFALVVFPKILISIIERGVFNSVGADPMIGAVVWFVLFGVVLFICGLSIFELEKARPGPLPRSLGWSLLALVLLGGVLMPVSGFWLALPPAISILLGKPSDDPAATKL